MEKWADLTGKRSVVVVNEILPAIPNPADQDVCCGPPPAPASSSYEKPGYRIRPWVCGFVNTAAGAVPRASVRLSARDFLGSVSARCGIRRNRYTIAPGLHCVGLPDPDSPVLLAATVSSYLGMNFTGSTPFTSPSGVEKEMRRAIPLQAAAMLVFALIWVGSAFTG